MADLIGDSVMVTLFIITGVSVFITLAAGIEQLVYWLEEKNQARLQRKARSTMRKYAR